MVLLAHRFPRSRSTTLQLSVYIFTYELPEIRTKPPLAQTPPWLQLCVCVCVCSLAVNIQDLLKTGL